MIPLTEAKINEVNTIKKIGGKLEAKLFLEKLGFVPGSTVTIINQISGNVIVAIRESRVAISKEMASKILV